MAIKDDDSTSSKQASSSPKRPTPRASSKRATKSRRSSTPTEEPRNSEGTPPAPTKGDAAPVEPSWLNSLAVIFDALAEVRDWRIFLSLLFFGVAIVLATTARVTLIPDDVAHWTRAWDLRDPQVRNFWLAAGETNAWQRRLQVPIDFADIGFSGAEGLVLVGDDRIFWSEDDGRFWHEAEIDWSAAEKEPGERADRLSNLDPSNAKGIGPESETNRGRNREPDPTAQNDFVQEAPSNPGSSGPPVAAAPIPLPPPFRPPQLDSVTFVDSTGWAVGGQIVLRSIDRGRTWTALSRHAGHTDLYGIHAASQESLWLLHDGGISSSGDGGASWQSVDLGRWSSIQAVAGVRDGALSAVLRASESDSNSANAALTAGCEAIGQTCLILTPYSRFHHGRSNFATVDAALNGPLFDAGFGHSLDIRFDLRSDSETVWAIWTPVPEPGTALLLGIGLMGLGPQRRPRQTRPA